jgi:hypothetical protein
MMMMMMMMMIRERTYIEIDLVIPADRNVAQKES